MKIGIDARFFGPESKGLGRYTQKLIEYLEKLDQENDYVIFLRRENFDTYTPQNPRFTKVCADYRWYTFKEQVFLPRIFKREKCDFIHFPHFNVPLLYRGKFLVTIHDLILLHYPTHEASTRGRFFYACKFFAYKFVIKSAIERAEHIFAVSHFTASDIKERYPLAANKISVTHEAADIQNVAEAKSTTKISCPYFLYVGNAYPHKNLSFLVRVFKKWQEDTGDEETKFILVGRNDYFYERLQGEIENLGVERITILDTITDAELVGLYKGARAFLFPSLYEGFGLPPLEAMGYGLPVLSSGHACMREILGDAALYADASDVEAFSLALEQLLSHQTLQNDLVKRGYAQFQKFTWQSTAKETLAVYKSRGSW